VAEQIVLESFDPYIELGSTGLKRTGGFIAEESLNALRGMQRYQTYQAMRDNEPILGASLRAIELLVSSAPYMVEPAIDGSQAANDYATWLEGALFKDMSISWNDTLTELCSMVYMGWSAAEICYKLRRGDHENPGESSQYNDGKAGWRKWAPRAQSTLYRWLFDAAGEVCGFLQQDPYGAGRGMVPMPIEKLLLCYPTTTKQNPEGYSLLRNAYVPYYHKKHIAQIQGIGVERDLAGLPVAYVPPDILAPNAPPAKVAMRDAMKQLVTHIRRDEREGIIFPLQYDEHGNQLYKLELLHTGGTRQFNTVEIIAQKNTEMAVALLTDLLLLGHEGVGSYALAEQKQNLLGQAINALLQAIVAPINRHAIPRLWRLNGFPMELKPTLTHGDVQSVDLKELGQFLTDMSRAGLSVDDLENEIRRQAGFQPRMDTTDVSTPLL